MRIDLHTHSTASDGTDTPTELVAAAAAAGLDVVALTDHDTTRGWTEAGRAAQQAGLTVVRGVELSCSVWAVEHGRPIAMHLLAYGFDPDEPAFAAARARMRASRIGRVDAWERLLRAAGHDVSLEPLRRQAETGTVGRPHLAAALVEAGLVASYEEAFGPDWAGGRLRVPREQWDVVDALAVVRAAGGATVFAHPYGRRRGGAVVGPDDIRRLAAAGLDGVEVDHPDHDEPDRAALRELADELGLLVTGASDYHGARKTHPLGADTTSADQYDALVARMRHPPGTPLPVDSRV